MTAPLLAPHTGHRCKPRPPSRLRRLARRARIAILWLLAVIGDAWLRWRTWKAEQTRRQITGRRTVDIEIARHDAQMARVEDHHVPPAVAAGCAVTALTVAATDVICVPPVRVGEPGPAATGPLPGAMEDADGDRPWKYATGQWPAYKEIVKGGQ